MPKNNSRRHNRGGGGGGSSGGGRSRGRGPMCRKTIYNWYIAQDDSPDRDWCLFGVDHGGNYFESSEITWPRITRNNHKTVRGWGSTGKYFTTVSGSVYCVNGWRQNPSEDWWSSSAVSEKPRKVRKSNKKKDKPLPRKSSGAKREREETQEKKKRDRDDRLKYGPPRR